MIIILFCCAAIIANDNLQPTKIWLSKGDSGLIVSGSFAISLIYVSYAYTGWNAATYLSSELEDPQKTLPWILITGTSIVMILYVLLNFVFLKVAPIEAMKGQIEIGYIAATHAFGETGGYLTGLALALLLISTVSAMTLAGPRVLQMIGEDYYGLRLLARTNNDGIPTNAIYIQSSLAILFILTSSFESILVFAGFTLALNSFATVLSIFVLRIKRPDINRPYQISAFPLPPLIYLTLTGWTLCFVLIERPVEALVGIGMIISGLIFYFISERTKKKI
jgi:APA family basic amino acid/polyamine antiporter